MFDNKRLAFSSKLLHQLKMNTHIQYISDVNNFYIKYAYITRYNYYKIIGIKFRDIIIIEDDFGLPMDARWSFFDTVNYFRKLNIIEILNEI